MAKKVKFNPTDIIQNPEDIFNNLDEETVVQDQEEGLEEENEDLDKEDDVEEPDEDQEENEEQEESVDVKDEDTEGEAEDDEAEEEEGEEEEEKEDDDEEEVFDKDKAKIVYDILSDFVELPELEEVTEEALTEALQDLPAKMLQEVVAAKGQFFEDLVVWLLTEDNPSPQSVKQFFDQFADTESVEIEEFDDPDAAREFLASTPEMRKIHKDINKLKAALDVLDDDEVLESANNIIRERKEQLEEKRKREIEERKKKEQELRKRQKEYWNEVKKTIETLDWSDTRKKKIVENIKPETINNKLNSITQRPQHLVELADILAYYDPERGFKELYDTLDTKRKAKDNSIHAHNLKKSKLNSYLKTKRKKQNRKADITQFIE